MIKEKSINTNNKTKVINAGIVNRNWKFTQEPRLEGLLQQLKYIKWTNVEN